MQDVHGNDTSVEGQLITLNIRLGEAEKEREVDFLRTILDDQLVFRRANGQVVNKETYLSDLVCPSSTYDRLVSEEVRATIHDDSTAVVSLNVRAKGMRHGAPFEGAFRNVRLFLRRQEGWRCVVWFNTRME